MELIAKEPRVSIVITTYNKKRDVLKCVRSLKELNYQNYEIIVVDNGSTDGTSEAIRQDFPDVKLITGDKNLGVTGGQNLGIKHSNGEYIFFFDHDLIASRNILSELVVVMQGDSDIGLAGPIIYYYGDPNRVWAAGTSIDLTTGKVSFNAVGQTDRGQFFRAMEVQVLPIYMVRREVFNRIGLFDDIYFLVYEDTDFCIRAKRAGYRIVCVPEAKVWHMVPLDRRTDEIKLMSRTYYIARNRIIFMRKHAKPLNYVAFALLFLPIYLVYYSLKALAFKRMNSLLGYWRGVFSGLSTAVARSAP
jgi:hypothetical protein